MYKSFVLLIMASSCAIIAVAQRKILALHGGGGTGTGFCAMLNDSKGNEGLANALGSEYEFVCPDAGYGDSRGYLWVPDPPGKGEPTTDPDIAIESVNILDQIVQDEGPFYGILGYSQGSMFTSYYVSIAPADTFHIALMFAGYLPETHLGLLQTIENASPIDTVVPLVWAGGQDVFYCLSLDQPTKFSDPVVIVNSESGHIVPDSSDSTFDLVLDFILDPANATSSPEETPDPENCVSSGDQGGKENIPAFLMNFISFFWLVFCS